MYIYLGQHRQRAVLSFLCLNLLRINPINLTERQGNLCREIFKWMIVFFSVASAGEATYLIGQVTMLLQNRGLNLTKWLSSDCDVLKSVPTTKLSNSAVNLTCKTDDLQVCERVLGLLWNCSDDNFQFSLQLKKKLLTIRGILSVLRSIFDLLGFLSPITLSAKLLLQDLCRRKLGWDDLVPEEDAAIWMR